MRRVVLNLVWVCLVCLALSIRPDVATAKPLHAMAMHGGPALPADFQHFPYVNPSAPKGGRMTIGVQGTFDSLNPFILKGGAANGIREYVYESLMARSADEPFTLYGLIAAGVDLPDDRGSVTFFLRPEAKFSDGAPITADDVLFSHAVLRDRGLAFYRDYYKRVKEAKALDAHTVRFVFDSAGDRELPLILGLMPILPRHRWTPETFERTSLEPPVGSGPYLVSEVDPGRSVTLRRNPDHWARDLNVNVGRFNFDEIKFDYFRDENTLFEAFVAGNVDARVEDDPSRIAQAYTFPALQDGRAVLREFPTGLPAGMAALVLKTRRPIFADPRVRRALLLAFDFSWINRNLYHSLYTRTESLFERSELASTGRPADERERQFLARFPGSVSPDIMDGRYRAPDSTNGTNRTNMRLAASLLEAAGYVIDGDARVDKVTRQPLRFEFLAQTRAQERLMLNYKQALNQLGIALSIRQVDSSQYWARLKKFDFDMLQMLWRASLSPGNEQYNRWGSAAADAQGSLNLAGVRSAAADAAIEALLQAQTSSDFTSAVRALDRIVIAGDYVIPLFHLRGRWIAYWHRLKHPDRTPLSGPDFDTWWMETTK